MSDNQENLQIPPEAIAALKNGQKIQAIKALRAEHKLGLAEAKEIIDKHIEDDATLRDQFAQQSGNNGRGLLVTLMLITLGVVWYLTEGSR